MKVKFAMHHVRLTSEMILRRGQKKDLHSEARKSWQALVTYVEGLAKRGASIDEQSLRKMCVGAGLRSCGDALSTAAIWGSDSGLVFLLHNQFAVWIPLHTTLTIHSSLDPSKSLFLLYIFPIPVSFAFLFTSPSNCQKTLYFSTNINVTRIHLSSSIFYPSSSPSSELFFG